MPVPISTALLVSAVALAIAGVGVLAVALVCGAAVVNEAIRMLVLFGSTQTKPTGEYSIPARPDPRVRGDDGG